MTKDEMLAEFSVHSFIAPQVIVTRKADNVMGTLDFTDNPRIYSNFQPL